MGSGHSRWRASRALAMGLLALGLARAAAAEEAAAPAAPTAPPKAYRWGVGWDEGLALRARLGNGWGLGLRLNPDWFDPEEEATSTNTSASEWQCLGTRTCRSEYDSTTDSKASGDARTFSGALMVYHEKKLGRWLAAGPYLAVSYERHRLARTETSEGQTESQYVYPAMPPARGNTGQQTNTTTTRRWDRRIGLELGVRPSFHFHERFVLETRFGVELGFTRWHETQQTISKQEGDSIYYPYPVAADIAKLPTSRSEWTETRASKGSERRVRTVGERLGPGAELRFVILF
jgi:hypothetical protein